MLLNIGSIGGSLNPYPQHSPTIEVAYRIFIESHFPLETKLQTNRTYRRKAFPTEV